MNIGIVGARKYKDKESVVHLVNYLPSDAIVITSSCKGVCTWAKEAAETRGVKVRVFAPDLTNVRARFEVAKRYYERNKQMIEVCDFLHAFVSDQDGYAGGTKFEIEYALELRIAVQVHWEKGRTEIFPKYPFPFYEHKQEFLLSWREFFRKTNLQVEGV